MIQLSYNTKFIYIIMQLPKKYIKNILLKSAIYISVTYIMLLIIAISITLYIFLNLENYKNKISDFVYTNTGYILTIKKIQTKLENYIFPEIILNEVQLTNPKSTNEKIDLEQIELVISYKSIIKLNPIFSKLKLTGTSLDINILENNEISINNFNIDKLIHKLPQTNKKFDFENYILNTGSIGLTKVAVKFTDINRNIPTIKLNNININLKNNFNNHHNFEFIVNSFNNINYALLNLNWIGTTITNPRKWNYAKFNFTVDKMNKNFIGQIKDLIPKFNLGQKNITQIEFEIKNGDLQYLHANLDSKNIQYLLYYNDNGKNHFPYLTGNINVQLNNNKYSIKGQDLTIAVDNNAIFYNKLIEGEYIINQSGNISIKNTNLNNFNNLINILPVKHNNFSLSGNMDLIIFSFKGNIFTPKSFNYFVSFKHSSIISNDPLIPSINNMTGQLNIIDNNGKVHLILQDSILNYKKVFLIPYYFKKVNTTINWIYDKHNLIITLPQSQFYTKDFTATISGEYKTIPNSYGYLTLKASIPAIEAKLVGNYLPITGIPMSVHKWLNMALIDGKGTNATLTLAGKLDEFPFVEKNSKGIFYIDNKIINGKLRYVDNWPTIDNIYGTFSIRNGEISILSNSAKVNNNNITKAKIVIPNMTADHPQLIAYGEANGLTNNFLTYLQQTPVNDIIGKIPETLKSTGNGNLNLKLIVPLDNPENTKVEGVYNISNNNLQFKLPIPEINNATGNIKFTNNGLYINDMNFSIFGAPATLEVTTINNEFKFKSNIINLDYNKLSNFYLPLFTPLVAGNANTDINFLINKHGLQKLKAHSNLENVSINFPKPLTKEIKSLANLDFEIINNYKNLFINFTYDKLASGKITLTEHGDLVDSIINIKNSIFNINNFSKINVISTNIDIYLIDWINCIEKLFAKKNINVNITKEPSNIKNSNIYPINIFIETNNLFFGKRNFKKTNSNISVTDKATSFNINNIYAKGYGTLKYPNNEQLFLDINMNYYRFQKTQKPVNQESQIITQNKIEAPKIDITKIPITTLKIESLFYESINLGLLSLKLIPKTNNLYLESGILKNNNINLNFSGINYCISCNNSNTKLQISFTSKNFGNFLDSINFRNIMSKGKAKIVSSLFWNNKLQNFDINSLNATINAKISNGYFLKVDTNSGFGKLLSILTLQTLAKLIKLEFSTIFTNGFYFDKLDINARLRNNILTIDSLEMKGNLASVVSNGTLNIKTNKINIFLSVTPYLGLSVAVGIGVATLNPLVGVIAYVAEMILGQPVNKLFTFSYKVTGTLDNPNVEKISVSKQIAKNINTTVTKY